MLRAAWWTVRAERAARRQLAAGRLDSLTLPSPPPLSREAARGVRAILRRRGAACLVDSAVWQAWYSGRGESRDLVIGVTPPGRGFRAHAWLESDVSEGTEGYHELLRRPPTR
jgi:hypothetical protein